MKRFVTLLTILLLAMPAQAGAQAWPSRPVRVIVPFGAGSAPDIVPRLVLEHVGSKLGQPFVVENRPGAGSTTGSAAVARSEADGSTLLATSSAYTVAPSMFERPGYDPLKDLRGVAVFGALPIAMVVAPDAPYKTIAEFVAFAKAGTKPLNFSTAGPGSGPHFSAERFRLSAGYKAAHVPFKGGGEALAEIVSGRIDYCFCPVSNAAPLVREGKVRALVTSQSTRIVALPDLPTTLEAGFANSDYNPWVGLLAPAATPRSILERLAAEIGAVLKDPKIPSRLEPNGIIPMAVSLGSFDAMIARELETNAALVKSLALKPAG